MTSVSSVATSNVRLRVMVYYFGIVLGGRLMGAWMGMFGDMLWRSIASATRYMRGRWLATEVWRLAARELIDGACGQVCARALVFDENQR